MMFKNKIKKIYLSVKVFSTRVLIGDTWFASFDLPSSFAYYDLPGMIY